MKKFVLILMLFFTLPSLIFAQDVVEDVEEEYVTEICYNLLEIIRSHQDGYFESIQGEVLFEQEDGLKTIWEPNIYLLEGIPCEL